MLLSRVEFIEHMSDAHAYKQCAWNTQWTSFVLENMLLFVDHCSRPSTNYEYA